MSHKAIIFLPLHYPFHFSDSYLDEEFNQLASKFSKRIVITTNTFSTEQRQMPPDTVLYRFNPHNYSVTPGTVFQLLFSSFFYIELYNLIIKYKLPVTIEVIKELFAFYARSKAMLDFIRKTIAEHQLEKSELLIYSYWMLEGGFAAALLRNYFPEAKIVVRAHSLDVYFERTAIKYHPFRRFMLNKINKLYFISANALNYFSEKHFISDINKKKVLISRIGFSANVQFTDKPKTERLRLISVGYIQKLKRIDLIVDALALLDIAVHWVHVGNSNHNARDFDDIQNYAKQKLGLKPNITYDFTGKTDKQKLFEMYEQNPFDLFLNVSETEGIPVSMMEAMSYSVPVIGTLVGGVGEIVEDGNNGYLLSAYPDAAEVRIAIERFAALSADNRSKLRKGAYDTWNEKYNANVNNTRFVSEVMQLF